MSKNENPSATPRLPIGPGTFVAIGGATLTGGALAWANWLLDIGAHL